MKEIKFTLLSERNKVFIAGMLWERMHNLCGQTSQQFIYRINLSKFALKQQESHVVQIQLTMVCGLLIRLMLGSHK